MDASRLEWDRAHSQKSDLKAAVGCLATTTNDLDTVINNISDHDEPELRAKAIELRRRFKDFGDLLRKKASEL